MAYLSLALTVCSTSCRQCFEVKCLDTAPFAGRCITGSNAVSVIVQITDICPECAADHLDIQALTYNKLSPMDTGRINIQYRWVPVLSLVICTTPQARHCKSSDGSSALQM